MTGVVVASFFIINSNNLSTRDYASIGDVPADSKKVFTGLPCRCSLGTTSPCTA